MSGAVHTYIAKRAELESGAAAVFGRPRDGRLRVTAPRTWPLAEGAAVHRALQGRATIGSVVLVP